MKWSNWTKTLVRDRPIAVPRNLADLQAVLSGVKAESSTLRPFGARHSHAPVAAPEGIGLDLRHFDAIEIEADQVRVGAGVRLYELNAALFAASRALSNLGDIDRQSIAGAISTGTHGTGLNYSSLPGAVLALEILLPSGDHVRVSPDVEPDIFAAATVGLGVFGIITHVICSTVPRFYLDALERPVPLAELMDDLDGFFAGADHAEFYLFPGTDVALTKINTRTSEAGHRSKMSRLWSEEVVENGLLQVASSLGALSPSRIPKLNRLAAATVSQRSYRDASAGVFTSPRRVKFSEIEYAIDYADLPQTMKEITDYLAGAGLWLNFPLEVRVGPPENAWLSPAYGRQTAYIAVQQYHRLPFYGAASIESILISAGGRPHWGKLHTQGAEVLADLYPRYEQAVSLRRELDPDGVLLTPYLSELLR